MLAITPLLDKNSSVPMYMQLYKYIREQIHAGALLQGERLPSIRQLALHLQISKNTVDAAYQQLLTEGYLASSPRQGYIILPLDELALPSTRSSESMSGRTVDNRHTRAIRFDFQYGDTDLAHFPHKSWKSCLIEAVSVCSNEVLGYGHPLGSPLLRAEIARYVYESRGVQCEPDQILITAGTQQAFSLLCQIMSLSKLKIGMEEPGYYGVKNVLLRHGCSLHPITLDTDGIDVEQLEHSKAQAVYVTPSHQFPLGMVLPVQKRIRLLQWAEATGSLIFEDDYDSEFRYYGQPIPSLKAMDRTDRVVYLGTFSKSFLPAVRLTYIILPRSVMHHMQEELMTYSQSVSPIIQQAVMLFMSRGYFTKHIRRMRRIYQSKHKALVTAISKYMGDRAEIIGDKSGLHLLLNVKNRNSDELLQLAEACGCRIYSPRKHWTNQADCPSSYVMLGFGGLTETEIDEGISLLSRAWFPDAL